MSRFTVKEHHKNFKIQDNSCDLNHKIIFNNKYDAVEHCKYLNQIETEYKQLYVENQRHCSCLIKIKKLVEKIHVEAGEIQVLEKAIKIKQLIEEML